MKSCSICGALVDDGVDICPVCGARVDEAKPSGNTVAKANPPIPPSDGKACPTCGATVAVGKKFCPKCGTKMAEPKEEPKAEQSKEEPKAARQSDGKVCPTCGATVAAGKRFCADCGAKMPEETAATDGKVCPQCGAVVADGKRFCSDCGARMPEETVIRFCPLCGAKADGKKFCTACGASLCEQRTQTPTAAVRPIGGSTAGKIKQILPTIGIMLTLVLTVAFMFLPFLSIKVSVFGMSEKARHWGATGIAVLFTGKSDMIDGGADEIVMRLAGAGYILLILAVVWYIFFTVSSVLKYDKKSLNNQIILCAVLTGITLFLMVLSAIAKSQIGKAIDAAMVEELGEYAMLYASMYKISWFMGAVGLFVIDAVMLIYAFVMRAIYKPELDRPALTPNLFGKKVRSTLAVVSAIAVIACTVIPIVLGCSGGAASRPDKAKEIADSGTFTVKCDETISEMGLTLYYGVAYYAYTPSYDGTVSVEVTSPGNDGSAFTMAAVGIGEYADVY